ncbi:MAG: endonuclease/exonuclease/phosphatase family protein [Pseudomonadota bacterium]
MAERTAARIVTALGALVAIGAAALLLLGQLGRLHPVPDIAAHLTWHLSGILLAGLSATCVAALLRHRAGVRMAIICALVIVLGTVAIPPLRAHLSTPAPLTGASMQSVPKLPGTLRLVAFNTWHGAPDNGRLEAFVQAVSPDVLFVAEFGPRRKATTARLTRQLPYVEGCSYSVFCAVAIFSRYPLFDARIRSRHLRNGPPSVAATMVVSDAQKVRVVGVHLMRPIDSRWGNRSEVRQIAGEVRRDREAPGGFPTIVLGDFNLTPCAENFRRFVLRSGLQHIGRTLPSWPAQPLNAPQLAIDHAFVSPDIAVVDAWLGPNLGSDHLPLVVDVRLP